MSIEKSPAEPSFPEIGTILPQTVLNHLAEHIIVSDSIVLRKLVSEDDQAIFNLIKRNPDIPTQVAFAKDVADVDDVLPSLQQRSNEKLDGRYAILAQNKLVGSIWAFPGSEEHEFGIGYCLDNTARGSGYATEAAKKMIEELKLLGASKVYFQIIIGNDDSSAVPKRLGCEPAEKLIGTDFPVEQQRWRLRLTS